MRYFFNFLLLVLSLHFSTTLPAQMWNGVDSLFGNEWIDYQKTYYKVQVAKDGIYRIPAAALSAQGIPTSSIEAGQYQLYYLGEEIPIYTNTNSTLSNGDYIEFYGQKNRSQLDQYLFKNPEQEMLNPRYSLFNDSSAYFLTWKNSNGLRVEEIENDFNNLPAVETSFKYEQEKLYTARAIKNTDGRGNFDSNFIYAEGFAQNLQNEQVLTLSPDYLLANNQVEVNLQLTTDQGEHNLEIQLNNEPVINETMFGHQLKRYNFNTSFVGTDDPQVDFKILGLVNEFDRHALSIVTMTYDRLFDFSNEQESIFTIGAGERKYLEITNFNHGGSIPTLYDVTNHLRIPVQLDNGVVKAVLPASNIERQLVLTSANNVSSLNSLKEVNFIDYSTADIEFLIISHPRLYDDGQGVNYVQQYVDYRSSEAGGNYRTLAVDIQQLYDQYAYGINRHNISVKNFANHVNRHWQDWRFALFLGKGREYNLIRTPEDLALDVHKSFYVPTYGKPGSDIIAFSSNNSDIPFVGVGRIPAANPDEIRIYLDKVKTFEDNYQNNGQTIEERGWMKRILHLGGGATPGEQSSIKNSLEHFGNIIVNNKFGAEVEGFYKTSADAIQDIESSSLTEIINNGVSMLTFFGHSNSNSFDFSLDNPANYDNIGKYPIVSSYGCYSGQIHKDSRSIGEDFTFVEERGSIGFYASVSQAYISDLRAFGNSFYRLLADEMYGQPIGLIHKRTIEELQTLSGVKMQDLLQQNTFEGDPAIRINPQPGVDYIPDTKSVTIEPSLININVTDSIQVNFDIVNIGFNQPATINLLIEQELPDGSRTTLKTDRVTVTQYRHSYEYLLPVLDTESVGLNKLHITVDNDNEVDELPDPAAENNNSLKNSIGGLGLDFLVFSNDARPIYPVKFGIVSKDNVTLKASTSNNLAPLQGYVFEIDTTGAFNSSVKQRFEIDQVGGVLNWQPSINYQDSTVYYWRVSPDSTAQYGYLWQNSSFLYIDEAGDGWNQSHYHQLQEAEYERIDLVEDRNFDFGKTEIIYQARNGFGNSIGASRVAGILQNNNNVYEAQGYFNGVHVIVFDRNTGKVWPNTPTDQTGFLSNGATPFVFGQYGSQLNPLTDEPILGFPYETTTLENRKVLMDFLVNDIPEDSYVAVLTSQSGRIGYFADRWAADSLSLGYNLFSILEAQGATKARELAKVELSNTPYVFIYRKGNPTYTDIEILGEIVIGEQFFVEFPIEGTARDGSITTPPIGPASNWSSLEWQDSDVEENDNAMLNIYGIDQNEQRQLIKRDLQVNFTTLNSIDAQQYPYLQLEYVVEDTIDRTPSQLDFWRVNYDGVPEAALNTAIAFEFPKDSLAQGEALQFSIAAENVSDYNMDSLLVKYTIKDVNNNEINVTERVKPLLSNESLTLDFNYDTKDLRGLNSLRVAINPDNDQPEQFFQNNIASKNFFVEVDNRNPTLDVTFDGVRIMNGDVVSPDPKITILLDDENKFLRLTDTSLFTLSLLYPSEAAPREMSFERNADIIRFFPASANSNNRATVELEPVFTENGTYTLIVQAKDASGNTSGKLDYRVEFEVVLENTISNVLNYPNPFSTSTHFVYTLTGHVPDYFKIQIMTVSGQIVREITQDELGNLQVGTHQTDYAWDGTDEYGDRLANGVYLYRVITKDLDGANDTIGVNYEKRNTGTDSYFKNGIGKMVLLR